MVVCVRGDVDSNTAGALVSALGGALSTGAAAPGKTVIVDLTHVTYFGSAGLNAVLSCVERGLADGVTVRLVATNAEVIRPIEVTKLDHVLRPYPSIAAAMAAGAGSS